MSSEARATSRPWWQSAVIYQVYPRSFQDSNGDGIGDLPGISGRLDYLAWLGITAIWLSPIFRSPMADFGYDIADYLDVDRMFGTLADLDGLIAEAHQRDIRILLDFVPNHTSDRHAWFVESRAARSSAHRDWYIWRDALAGGGPPNAWQSAFGGSAWEWDEPTGQYYFHSFLKEQPDLNWDNPAVRDAMYGVLRFWFERGIDGFRIDVVDLIAKRAELLATREGQRQAWGDLRRIQPRIAGLRAVADEFDDRVLIGEIWRPLRQLVTFYGRRDRPGLQLPFNFQLLLLPWSARRIGSAIERYESLLPAGAWPNWVLSNHDKSRIATRVGDAQARVAAMLLLTLRGTPTVYYGDEIGIRDGPVPRDAQRDPQGLRGMPSRDPERTPMRWDATPRAGFSRGTPWLPIGDEVARINVAAERDDPTSMLQLYRRLLTLRRAEPALATGDWAPIAAERDLLVYRRSSAKREFIVALNLGRREVEAEVGRGRIVLSTHLDRDGELVASRVRLRPNEGVVVRAETKV